MTYPNALLPFSASVQFSGAQSPSVNAHSMRIVQEEFHHDLVVMDFWADDVMSDSYQSGMPVSVVFGRPLSKRIFYGYVNHAYRTNNALADNTLMERNSTTVYCVGAGWRMKDRGTKTWTNYTIPQVITEIAALFGLEADVDDDDTVWPVLQMAGASYWSFCVGLAQRIGFTFYASGIRLVCKHRQTNPTQIRGLVASYNYRGGTTGLPIFTPVVGATNPTGGELAVRQIGGIDPRTLQPIVAEQSGSPQSTYLGSTVNTPVFTRTDHSTVTSLSQALARVRGSGESNQLYITASATGAGNPAISQGSLIYVENANGSQNGLWFVIRVEHVITTTNYTMQLDLGRDSLGGVTAISGQLGIDNPPKAQLRNATWVAA